MNNMCTTNIYRLRGGHRWWPCRNWRWPQWCLTRQPPANFSDIVLVAPRLQGLHFGFVVWIVVLRPRAIRPAETQDVKRQAHLGASLVLRYLVSRGPSTITGLAHRCPGLLITLQVRVVVLIWDAGS